MILLFVLSKIFVNLRKFTKIKYEVNTNHKTISSSITVVGDIFSGHNRTGIWCIFEICEISIRGENIDLSRIAYRLKIVQGRGLDAIRARPILVEDKRGSLPKRCTGDRLSHDDPREIFSSFGPFFGPRDIADLGTSFIAVFVASSSKSQPGRFSSRWFAGPHGDSITAFCRALKTGGAHTVLFFILNLDHAKGKGESVYVCVRERVCRGEARWNEWVNEAYLDLKEKDTRCRFLFKTTIVQSKTKREFECTYKQWTFSKRNKSWIKWRKNEVKIVANG